MNANKHRTWLTAILAVALAISIFPISARSLTAEESSDEITLRMSWWGNQVRNENTNGALESFSEKYPNIKVEAEFSDWSGYWDRLATQTAANNLPDIIQQDNQYLGQYYSRDLLLNLDPYVENGELDISSINPSIVDTGKLDGSIYSICAGVNAVTMLYDKAIATEAGVELPERIHYDELLEINQKIFDESGVHAYYPAGLGTLHQLCRDMGEQIFDHENHKLGASDETLLKYFEMTKTAMEADWAISLDKLQEETTSGVENSSFTTGDAWNYFPGGSNQLDAIEKAAGKEFSLAFFPQREDATAESMYLRPALFYSVTTQSAHPDESVMLIDYFTNDEGAQDHLMAERGVPVSSEMRDYLKPKVSDVQQRIFDYIEAVDEIATPFDPPYPAGSGEVGQLIDDYTSLVRYGEMSPEDAASMLRTEVDAALERAAR